MFINFPKPILSSSVRILFVFSVVCMLSFTPYAAAPSKASDITLLVDTLSDLNAPAYQVCSEAPNDCSLRGAISIANANPTNSYTISIPAGTYSLSLPGASEDENNSGDLDIKADVALTGMQGGVTIDGNQIDRVLHIHPAAKVLIQNIQISGGKSPDGVQGDGQPGGAIYNQGSLTLNNCLIQDNQAGNGDIATIKLKAGAGGSGGGIQNDGQLTIIDSLLSTNTAGTGGKGYICDSGTPYDYCGYCNGGGTGGLGGGINNNGLLKISNTTLENNLAGLAGSPGRCVIYDYFYTYGKPGTGGGIANQVYVSLSNSTLNANQGGLSGGGLNNQGYAYLSGSSIYDNNATEGGGLSNKMYLEIENSMLNNNSADKGGSIYNTAELHISDSTLTKSNAALGGGIYNEGEVLLAGVLIEGNWTRYGPDGEDETPCVKMPCPPGDGGSPHGGGIYNEGFMQLDQGTVSYNSTGDGGKGGNAEFYTGANGGSGGFGGGIYNRGSFILNFIPVISNTTGDGGSGGTSISGDGQDGPGGFGGGIYNTGTMTVTLAKVAGNQTGTGPGGVGRGGGIANQGNLLYSYGIISDNQTSPSGDGGGVYSSSPFTLTASKVLNNVAGGRGGGILADGGSLFGASDLVARNTAGSGYQGSGIYLDGTATSLLHTSLAQNSGGDGSAISIVGASLQMTNTILVSHTIGISVATGAEAILDDTLWGTGTWANETDWAGSGTIITGTHNIWLEPGFVDPVNLDYHLKSNSAAIDRGIPTTILTDIDNQPRPNPVTAIADLGADEYWAFTPISKLELNGPLTGTTYTTITLTASISPEAATPNILVYWFPPPESGQFTNTARYQWNKSGVKTIQVTAIQAGNVVTETHAISLEAGVLQLFFPVINR